MVMPLVPPFRYEQESHGGVVKLDELVGVFTLVNAVGKEGRHLDLVVDADITRDDVVGSVVGEGDAPHVGLHASPASDDGLAVVRDIAAGGVEQYFASSVAKNGHGD